MFMSFNQVKISMRGVSGLTQTGRKMSAIKTSSSVVILLAWYHEYNRKRLRILHFSSGRGHELVIVEYEPVISCTAVS
jgi:hypothetical protein